MTLNQTLPNQKFRIVRINHSSARQQAIRLGLGEGSIARCLASFRNGPVVLMMGRQQIAIGQKLAHQIEIKLVTGDESL